MDLTVWPTIFLQQKAMIERKSPIMIYRSPKWVATIYAWYFFIFQNPIFANIVQIYINAYMRQDLFLKLVDGNPSMVK